ncbi:dienelactone hydrolase family protein [Priestia filamentosa]|uniref:dienelactone hydrolase family protein n=1 Tax=Priestia filamentosa TaxID=1402861 RepID=UPI001FB37F7E|nr:dienelactone hydrolase family protein [Priestia filamentosa]MED3727574.1 dienelactone hydrolase family protein [Priestia filamentosa]
MEKYNMAIILVHEIYGVNEHMQYMKKRLSKLGIDVICPNLLHNDISYSDAEEEHAYKNFIQNIGFENGVLQINRVILNLKQQYRKVGVMGFSVGATISWLCGRNNICDFIIGCYGSRIRHYVDVKPVCPTLLIFANKEKSFDVPKLVDLLEEKRDSFLEIKRFEGSHGFMNPFSSHYNKLLANQALQHINKFVQKQLNESFLLES